MMLASTIVPARRRRPRFARWALIVSNSFVPRSWRSSRWRKWRMVLSSGMSSVRVRPQKRRTDSAS